MESLGKSNESMGTTTIENMPFNTLDIATRNDRHEMMSVIESLLLDDCDAVIDDNMSDIFETSIEVNLYCTSYTSMVNISRKTVMISMIDYLLEMELNWSVCLSVSVSHSKSQHQHPSIYHICLCIYHPYISRAYRYI